MKTTIDFDRAEQILAEKGGMSFESWAREVISEGAFDAEYRARSLLRTVQRDLSQYAKQQKDSAGLPRIGPTAAKDEDGKRVVQLRQYWMFDDYQYNISDRLTMAAGNIVAANALADECEQRCGIRPTLERLPELDYGDEVDLAA